MRTWKTFVLATAAMTAIAGSAHAAPFDPAQQGPVATNFLYGYQAGGAFTAYTAANFTPSGCLGSANVSCLTGGPSDFLGVYFASQDTPANTATLLASEVTLHPGANGELSVVRFVAPTAGSYSFTGAFRNVDAPNGNGVIFSSPGGSGTYAAGGSSSFAFTRVLSAGQFADFSIGNNGGYSFDTTGLRLTVTSAVPEPTSWALMIGGVGLVGGALRRRTSAVRASAVRSAARFA